MNDEILLDLIAAIKRAEPLTPATLRAEMDAAGLFLERNSDDDEDVSPFDILLEEGSRRRLKAARLKRRE